MTLPTDIVPIYYAPSVIIATTTNNAQPPVQTPVLIPKKLEPFIIPGIAEFIAVTEDLARITAKVRALTETVTIGAETLALQRGHNRTLTETVTIGETLSRLVGKIRALSETVAVSESLTRIASKFRSLATETVAVSDAVARVRGVVRIEIEIEIEILSASGTQIIHQ